MQTRCPYQDCQKIWQTDQSQTAIYSAASNGFLRGLCLYCQRPATFKPAELIEQIAAKYARLEGQQMTSGGPVPADSSRYLSALLEDVRSLQNIGSIFRSADALGFSRIYLTGISGTPNRREFMKTSLSAEQHVFWRYEPSSLSCLWKLKEQGVLLVGLEKTNASCDLAEICRSSALSTPLCLVLGNEVSGVSEEALSVCDVVCHIPMCGHKESLNIAVAFGIAAYQVANALANNSQQTSLPTDLLRPISG